METDWLMKQSGFLGTAPQYRAVIKSSSVEFPSKTHTEYKSNSVRTSPLSDDMVVMDGEQRSVDTPPMVIYRAQGKSSVATVQEWQLEHFDDLFSINSELYQSSQSFSNLKVSRNSESDDVLSTDFGQYDDFHTIDWLRDLARDRMRHRLIVRKKHESFWSYIQAAHDAWSGWLCVFIIGIACGTVAAMIDIGTSWMVDLRQGICPEAFWLNREQCCWSSNSTKLIDDQCEEWLNWSEVFQVSTNDKYTSYIIQYALYVAWSLFFSFLAVMLVKTFAPYAVGGGIPEIKTVLSGFIMRGLLGKWTLIIKSVGVMLAVSAGLVLGKEGPLVHVACCIGNIVTYLFPKYGKNEAKKREILSAAAAAGVSVAFGSPIGGVLFSLEEVSYYFPLKTLWRSFFCAMVAAFVLLSINPFGNEHMIVFYVNYTTPWMFVELIPFMILGVMGGLIASCLSKANLFWCRFRKSSKLGQYAITEVMVITLITAVLSYPNEYTRMDTSQLIALLVRNCKPEDDDSLCDYVRNATDMNPMGKAPAGVHLKDSLYLLTGALFFKIVMLIVTVGIRLPAGLYIPSLSIGAILGRIVGVGVEQLFYAYPDLPFFKGECGDNCIAPGLYAMVGAAAVLGGITRMTVALVVIMFEVTGGVKYIVPLMAAVMASKWVGDAISKKGIYEGLIDLNGYPFLDIKDEFTHTSLAVDVMQPRRNQPLVVLTQDGLTIKDIESLLKDCQYNGFPVVVSTDSQYLIGFVVRKDLILAIENAKKKSDNIVDDSVVLFTDYVPQPWEGPPPLKLRKILDMATITITDETPMETVIDMFRKLGLRQTLITHNGRLLGIITKKDILKHIKELGNEDPESVLFN